jgi:hypothetical protein
MNGRAYGNIYILVNECYCVVPILIFLSRYCRIFRSTPDKGAGQTRKAGRCVRALTEVEFLCAGIEATSRTPAPTLFWQQRQFPAADDSSKKLE